MTVTYTRAAERDVRRARRTMGRGFPDALLCATSLVAALAIALAYFGRVRAFDASEAATTSSQVVNLNTVRDPGALEGALAPVFIDATDRVFAARELFRFITADAATRVILPNVGVLSRATVSTESISSGEEPARVR